MYVVKVKNLHNSLFILFVKNKGRIKFALVLFEIRPTLRNVYFLEQLLSAGRPPRLLRNSPLLFPLLPLLPL